MDQVSDILEAIGRGESSATEKLLPLVYKELRGLAAARMRHERPDHTLQATELVHEAYLRLVGNQNEHTWSGRAHFFAAAAEAMRRILVDHARQKDRQKRGANLQRQEIDKNEPPVTGMDLEVLALNEALAKLAEKHPEKTELVKLRYFCGMTLDEAAEVLGFSSATADRYWKLARVFLARELADRE